MTELGECYMQHPNLKEDYAEAFKLFQLAAKQNDVHAITKLAGCYDTGIGVTRDRSEAIRLFRIAAIRGHSLAQARLADHYRRIGNGIMYSCWRAISDDTQYVYYEPFDFDDLADDPVIACNRMTRYRNREHEQSISHSNLWIRGIRVKKFSRQHGCQVSIQTKSR
jgi:TPR repeat protein